MKISVIIPAYNCAEYICRSIDSVLNQKPAPLEVIVVNDGSTDDTEGVLYPYRDRIRLISTANAGVAAARNTGLSAARGDFVIFCDADDFYAEGAFCRLVEIQSDTDADIVRGGYSMLLPDGRTAVPRNGIEQYELVKKADFPEKIYPLFLSGIRLNSIFSTLYRRSILDGVRFDTSLKTCEDACFNLAAFTNAQSAVFTPDGLYVYYRRSQSLTGSGLGIAEKYRCNFSLAARTIKYLGGWGMDSPMTRIRALIRPIRLTVDKLLRRRDIK